jgi:GDP-D-mannose 3',5'-epimerase
MRICVSGAGGFIASHLVRRLKEDGHWVRGVDLKRPRWSESAADEFMVADMRDWAFAHHAMHDVDWAFALAADMGGMGFITTQDAPIIRNNTLINIHSIDAARDEEVKRYLFSSSACIYPMYLQDDDCRLPLREQDAYPAAPQRSYGWEKLHTEHLCKYYHEAGWLDPRVARFHNCYGTEGEWEGGREKAPAALCRKVAMAVRDGLDHIEVWGDGKQVRSYMHVSDCVEGLVRLMESDHTEPLNIGSDHAVTVDELARIVMDAAGVDLDIWHVPGPEGVRWRNSDNSLCRKVLGWEPTMPLEEGIAELYKWVSGQVKKA